jgi:hypothetical protein
MRSHRYPRPAPTPRSAFAGYRFPPEVIALAVRWYLRFAYRSKSQFHLRCPRVVLADQPTDHPTPPDLVYRNRRRDHADRLGCLKVNPLMRPMRVAVAGEASKDQVQVPGSHDEQAIRYLLADRSYRTLRVGVGVWGLDGRPDHAHPLRACATRPRPAGDARSGRRGMGESERHHARASAGTARYQARRSLLFRQRLSSSSDICVTPHPLDPPIELHVHRPGTGRERRGAWPLLP